MVEFAAQLKAGKIFLNISIEQNISLIKASLNVVFSKMLTLCVYRMEAG